MVKHRCNLEECNSRVSQAIGYCKFCENNFCLTHRLPELHECSKLDTCKKDAFEKNKKSLESNQKEKIKIF